MKEIRLILFFLALGLLGSAQTYHGTVLRVVDGDTFVFQTEDGSFRVRLQGIDAPEKDQPFGKESTAFLSQFLDRDAIVEHYGVDQYGRILGTLIVDSININLLSLKNGCSWHFKRYSKDIEFSDEEVYARTNRLGLWKLDNPIPPWEWRKAHH